MERPFPGPYLDPERKLHRVGVMCVDNVARCRISLRTTKDKGVVGECHTTLVCVSGRTSSSCIILLEFVWLHMAGYAANVHPLGTDRRSGCVQCAA